MIVQNDNPLGGAIGSVLGSVVNSIANIAYNEHIRKENLKYWHLQNSYNAPASQVERLKAAGLNPNLFYGSGAGVLQAGDISPAQPVNIDSGKAISNAISDYMLLRQGDANVKATEANTNLTNAKLRTEGLHQQSIQLQNSFQRMDNMVKDMTKDYEILLKKEGYKGAQLDNALKGYNNELSRYNMKVKQLTWQAEVDNIMNSVLLNKQQLENMRAGMFNTVADTWSKNVDTSWRKEHYDIGVGTSPLETFIGRGGKTIDSVAKSWFNFPITIGKYFGNHFLTPFRNSFSTSKWKRGYGSVRSH